MKRYNGEKAIISLTSWKKRINTVGKTIFSLLQQCSGFHIVLVLSEEEFPKKEEELPEDLKILIEGNKIEVVWVYKNYGSFKKVLFTLDKYREVPIISADDDCLYNCNYAQILYDEWLKNKNSIITNRGGSRNGFRWSQGPNTLYPPFVFGEYALKNLTDEIIKTNNDDGYNAALIKKLNKNIIFLNRKNFFSFHDSIEPLGNKTTFKKVVNEISKFYSNLP